jgi:hypothetical protein
MNNTSRTDAARLTEQNGCITTYQGAEIVRADEMRKLEHEIYKLKLALREIEAGNLDDENYIQFYNRAIQVSRKALIQ